MRSRRPSEARPRWECTTTRSRTTTRAGIRLIIGISGIRRGCIVLEAGAVLRRGTDAKLRRARRVPVCTGFGCGTKTSTGSCLWSRRIVLGRLEVRGCPVSKVRSASRIVSCRVVRFGAGGRTVASAESVGGPGAAHKEGLCAIGITL